MRNMSEGIPLYDDTSGLDIVELQRLANLTQTVWSTVPLVLVIVGTLGNALSILVLTRPNIGHSSMTLYLTVLAVSDTICLYLGAFNYWLFKVYDLDLGSTSPGLCKIYSWLLHTFLDFSPWLLVAVTVERVVCVWMPHQVKVQFTRKRSALVIVVIFATLMLINAHLIAGTGLQESLNGSNTTNKSRLTCGPTQPHYARFLVYVWPWLDLCIFSLIPTFILSLGSALIILKVTRSARKRSSLSGGRTSIGQCESRAVERRRLSSLTMVLLSLIVVFALATSPVSIFLVLQRTFLIGKDLTTLWRAELAWAIVCNVMYLANALNFFMFIICGSRLRQTFCRLFTRTRSRRLPATLTTSASLVTANNSRRRQSEDTDAAGCCSWCPRLRHHSASRQASTESERSRASCPSVFHVEAMQAGTAENSSSGGFADGFLNAALCVEDSVRPQQRSSPRKFKDFVTPRGGRTSSYEIFNPAFVGNLYHVSPLQTSGLEDNLAARDLGIGSYQNIQKRDYDVPEHPPPPRAETHEHTTTRQLAPLSARVGLVSVGRTHL